MPNNGAQHHVTPADSSIDAYWGMEIEVKFYTLIFLCLMKEKKMCNKLFELDLFIYRYTKANFLMFSMFLYKQYKNTNTHPHNSLLLHIYVT